MNLTLFCLIAALLCLAGLHRVDADFFFNHITPKKEELADLKLKCVPGRTVIRIKETHSSKDKNSSSDEDEGIATDTRKSHMTFPAKDNSCQMCVCSAEGKDEYCSERPAVNVNECLMMSKLMDNFHSYMPFDHKRNLAFRIRRDYLWHDDEIPYEANAKCQRGHSYYTNDVNANDTTIDVGSDVESLLDYSNKDVCYYCVCSARGREVGCISRRPWYCEYYRVLREGDAPRDMYRQTLQQDRPAYFRQLSYRLRRTMDAGIFDLVDSVGGEPTGKKCVPFVSQYDDCNAENQCMGCTKCTCTAQGTWSCKKEKRCSLLEREPVDEEDIDNALQLMEIEMKNERMKQASSSSNPLVPSPPKLEDLVIETNTEKKFSIEDEIMDLMRPKRSIKETDRNLNNNNTVKFYHTVDEINEDTLKNNNTFGTVTAKKVDVSLQTNVSRRIGLTLSDKTNPLHIAHNEKMYQHMTDNKIDNVIEENYEKQLKKNYTESQKDKHVSKVIVNELKTGTELIGDKNARVTSNVTFTPENDTLTAMAFIAGNLLNKLWNMERDSTESLETDIVKHEKISDLIELFKEPLSLRQEMFLKSALEKLSGVIDKNEDVGNLTLCGKFEEAKKLLIPVELNETNVKSVDGDTVKTAKALDNIKNVLTLISKYENVNQQMLRKKTSKNSFGFDSHNLTKDENVTLNSFGRILEKVTKLIMPNNKHVVKKIKKSNMFKNEPDFAKNKKYFQADLTNLNLTAKDKIILDYISHIEKYPDCLLKDQSKQRKIKSSPSFPSVESNIMLNLSEFFKMKSLADLVKLLDNDKINKTNIERSKSTTEMYTSIKTTQVPKKVKSLEASKEKLKAHLKSILEDLVEIQNAKGMPTGQADVKIKDILPCLYNSLNSDKPTNIDDDPVKKISNVFTNLKRDLKYTSQTRRSSTVGHRPKSAVVWERLIKNLNENKINTRRNILPSEPKSYSEIKKALDNIKLENVNTKLSVVTELPAAEKAIVLRTLNLDIRKIIEILENVKDTVASGNIPNNKINELHGYVDVVAKNINLKTNILSQLNSNNQNMYSALKTDGNVKDFMPSPNLYKEENVLSKITRDQIVNQLIKNRIQRYLRMKQIKYYDTTDDVIYDIAKKILLYLENGNAVLARELYKIFVKRQIDDNSFKDRNEPIPSVDYPAKVHLEPIVSFSSPQPEYGINTQERLIKQLINMKNMKI